jgi:hypothetical protein
LKVIPALVAQRLGKEKVAGPKVWKHAGIPAQGFESRKENDDFHKINSNLEQNQQNEILPNTVRILPNTVRNTHKQGNALSLHQSYQGTRENISNKFWIDFEEYLNKSYRKSSVKCRLLYAKQYYYVITDENARDIIGLPLNKKLQVMKSLAILSK